MNEVIFSQCELSFIITLSWEEDEDEDEDVDELEEDEEEADIDEVAGEAVVVGVLVVVFFSLSCVKEEDGVTI